MTADVINFCACLGPMYNEPVCPCEMRRRGLERSPECQFAQQKAQNDLERLFGPGGQYHTEEKE